MRSGRFAGVERSILLSARALAERGHHVSVIGGEQEAMTGSLAELGVSWRPALSILGAARELWRQGRVDIVHAHMTAAETAALPLRWRTGGRLVVTRHFGQRRGLTPLGGIAARVIDRVSHSEIAISEYVQSTIGVPSTVVYHGIEDVPAVQSARSQRVIVIQRLEPEKRTDLAVSAWARSGLAEAGWTLHVAGDGNRRHAVESLARSLGVDRSVHLLGHVDGLDELRRSSAIHLATTPIEGFGMAVLESMACGLPVVAADGGAHRELLGDDYPMLFPPGDVDAAAACLRRLADDEAMRQSLGASLRRRQQEQFSLQAHGAALEAVYLRALGLAPVEKPAGC